MCLGQYNSIGEYCGLSTASEVFLILILLGLHELSEYMVYDRPWYFLPFLHVPLSVVPVPMEVFSLHKMA